MADGDWTPGDGLVQDVKRNAPPRRVEVPSVSELAAMPAPHKTLSPASTISMEIREKMIDKIADALRTRMTVRRHTTAQRSQPHISPYTLTAFQRETPHSHLYLPAGPLPRCASAHDRERGGAGPQLLLRPQGVRGQGALAALQPDQER